MITRRRLHPDVGISIVTILFAALLLFETRTYPDEVRMFPRIFIYIFIGLMVITLVSGIRKTLSPESANNSEWWCRFEIIRYPLLTGAFVVVYVALINLIGFYISTAVYLLVAMRTFGEKRWKVNLGVAVVILVFCYVLFDRALSVTLPIGMIFKAIG